VCVCVSCNRSAPGSPTSLAEITTDRRGVGGGGLPPGCVMGGAEYYTECSSESLTEMGGGVAGGGRTNSSAINTSSSLHHQVVGGVGGGSLPPATSLMMPQRLIQLSNEMRFVQSAPGSPQSLLTSLLNIHILYICIFIYIIIIIT